MLSEREARYLTVSSPQPYLFVSTGKAYVTGIEHVDSQPVPAAAVALGAGRWACSVHLIDWEAEPGMATDDGPHPDALPDFVVLVNPVEPGESYRTDFLSFPPPA